MEEITFEESLKLDSPVYVDVRSPGEYEEDHVPGAINLPIFNDDERKEVGTLYKMAGRDVAVKRGVDIGGNKIGTIVSKVSEMKGKNLVINCARGGMRSGSVASLISSLGIRTYRMKDGYKSYRKYVLRRLETVQIKPQIFILQGLTGAGKTEILNQIDNSIDLEGIAGHRSSVFGAIGLSQKSQKSFDTLLLKRIDELEDKDYVVIEGESRKVGHAHIPDNIFRQMRSAPPIYIDTSMDRRVYIIKKEYDKFAEHNRIIEIVNSLRGKLGNPKANKLVNLYKEGNIGAFIEMLLNDYYDSLYRHTLTKLEYIGVVKNMDSHKAAQEVLDVIDKYLKINVKIKIEL